MVVEVMVVIDFSVFQKFMRLSNNVDEARSRISTYYAHIVNLADQKFRSVETSKYFYSIYMVDMYICETIQDSMFTFSNDVQIPNEEGKIDYLMALAKFNIWLKSRPNIKHYDVASFFTLFSQGNVKGMAYENSVCENNRVCGATDKGVIGTSISFAHEIGHVLGSSHDNQLGCNEDDQYIMAKITKVGPNNHHTFSNCSISSFEKRIDELEGNRLTPGSTQNCLTKDQISGEKIDITSALNQKLGLQYSVDQQCQAIFGVTSQICSIGIESDENKCNELVCMNPSTNTCQVSSGSIAWDGTPCGPNKWCINKKCVYDVEAPSDTESCQHGDLTDGRINFKCSSVLQNPHNCYQNSTKDLCCASCKAIATENPECIYGDKNPQCRTLAGVCINEKNHVMCCNTCVRKMNPAMPRPDATPVEPTNPKPDQPWINGGDSNLPVDTNNEYTAHLLKLFRKNCANFETSTSQDPEGKPSAYLMQYCNNIKGILWPETSSTNTRPNQPIKRFGGQIVTLKPESPINNKNVKCKPGDKDLVKSCPERYCLNIVYLNLCCATCAGKN